MDLEEEVLFLGLNYIGVRYEERKWKALFKFSYQEIANLCRVVNETPSNILHLLYYMKTYPTYDMASSRTFMDTKTFRKRLYETANAINDSIPQLQIEDRFVDWDLERPSCVVDGFDCSINEPRILPFGQRTIYHSHKIGSALRYVVATNIRTGKFIWLSDAFPGASSEIVICQENLIPLLGNNETILADGLYRNTDRFMVAPEYDCPQRRIIKGIRSKIERRIGLIRHFRIFEHSYRSYDYNFHCTLVHLACRMINYLE